jgi:sigma-B regulation protein RsbU (phosphoserine phosphatase)
MMAGEGRASTMTTGASASPPRGLQCMEVWGGNQAVETRVSLPGLEGWVYSRPYRGEKAGGDLHYISSCATGRITRLLLADVSGHGEAVASLALKLRALMRRYVNYLDQTRLVGKLDQAFSGLAGVSDFATAVVATYWAPTDHVSISNAGHPPPFRYRAARSRWEVLAEPGKDPRAQNTPLGIVGGGRYEELKLRLDPGDLLLFYTDSLVEAEGAGGRFLGQAGLLELLGRLNGGQPDRLIGQLLREVEAYRGGAPAADDVTLLLLCQSGRKPRRWLYQGVASLGRLGRALAVSFLPGREPMGWPELRLENILGPFSRRLNQRWGRESADRARCAPCEERAGEDKG